MKETYIIEITAPSEFGISFMRSIIKIVVSTLNGYRKCYKCNIEISGIWK